MILHSVQSSIKSATNQTRGRRCNLLLVLIHGLDSSRHTWRDTMQALQDDVACLAVDQRGCGYSPLGDLSDFSQPTLVADLHETIQDYWRRQKENDDDDDDTSDYNNDNHNDQKIVLLGHSLGGRIALGYAATYPERLAACIIEDMDIAPRPMPTKHDENAFVVLQDYDGPFDQWAATEKELRQRFMAVGYPETFWNKAVAQGRIGPSHENNPLLTATTPPGGWWSHVNPDFRKYCYPHVLSTQQAGLDCDAIFARGQKEIQQPQPQQQNENQKPMPFPIHILVAGAEGTVCRESSIVEMQQRLGGRATLHRYPTAGHSIHSTAAAEFLQTIRQVITSVS